MGLVSELRRRNVLRMVVLYVIAAWLVMQVAEVLIGLANLPGWTGPATLVLLAIGFPIALLFSWFYEITPEGISLEKDVEPADSITHITGRRLDFIVISLLCAAVLLFAYDKWWMTGPSEESIAVLPFENTSSDSESAGFLAIGIQDDLLTRLSKIGALKVISRTSADRYRNTTMSLHDIARELGVSKVVEGGVQRAGNQIRVNVQLIDAELDEHIWAETYDRRLTAENVFDIQSEIVETIVRELETNLTPQETLQLTAMPTRNFDAYTVYLKGMNQAGIESVESLNAAVAYFRQAIELDENFALAYVGLADAYLTLGANFLGGLQTAESNALAEPAVVRALDLDSNLGQAHATLGFLRRNQGRLDAAEAAFEQAIRLQPNYPRVFRFYGRLRWQQDRPEEALVFFEKALELDPFSATATFDRARIHDEMGRFDEALDGYLRVIEIEPDHAFAYVYVAAIHFLVYGRADESLVWYHKAAQNDALSPSLQAAQSIAYLELDDPESARIWVDRGMALGPDTFWAMWSSLCLNLYLGDENAAQEDARAMHEQFPRNWGSLYVLRNFDIAAGRYDVARSRYARAFPELSEPEIPQVSPANYFAAVDFALVLIHLEQKERAADLLDESLKVIKTLNRHGTAGYWITDARIYAMQQRPQLAIDAFGEAVNEGWRVLSWFFIDHDPGLDSIRGEPKFQELHEQLKADLAAQARRTGDLKASGEL
ncbi:MAG: tetratricopeptide repeat protein [Gammaproteobacteria bacterium]|nr:tetratricopeptide repeat protein [Gammaproteobacteria bacterium]